MASFQSADLIAHEVERELEAKMKHFDSLDSKAGLLIAFSGALIAFAASGSRLASDGVRVFAALAALAAFASFWPRKAPSTKVMAMREGYLGAEERFTQLKLIDTHIQMIEDVSEVLRRKARMLKVAIVLTVGGVLAGAVLTFIPGGPQ